MPSTTKKTALLKEPAAAWKRIGNGRRAGVAVPLFSVYSKDSVGIGDLGDLELLAHWSAATGMSIIQLLPMNEVGALFCPYDSISSFALEPSYVCLSRIQNLKPASYKTRIAALKKKFSSGARHVDYAIKGEKLRLLWEIFCDMNQAGLPELHIFEKNNAYWLDDFALFKALKERHNGAPWDEWEGRFRDHDLHSLTDFSRENAKELAYHKWVQWILHYQFIAARRYANERGILIKGDMPVLVSKDSADVWAHRAFFKLEFAAGAPPDLYCAKGQRWGMPTYNWAAIAEDGNNYFKEKLRVAEQYYDIARIDHVVGLFRMWSIPVTAPLEDQGIGGTFDPRDESIWTAHGREKLKMLTSNTRMLLAAEDLGMIPKECPIVLAELAIPGNDVQRWAKDWTKRHDFLGPDEYRAMSVSMLSTHDTTNWTGWWENEAGTVDEDLFYRKCQERSIDIPRARSLLFDEERSHHGRLRWKTDIGSADTLVSALGKGRGEIADFIDMYLNTYGEKEKLWNALIGKRKMTENATPELLHAAVSSNLISASVFSIQLIIDYAILGGIFKGDPYEYRINVPGTISPDNWSIRMPISLEKIIDHPLTAEIRELVHISKRERKTPR